MDRKIPYHSLQTSQSVEVSGLHYIACALGEVAGSQLSYRPTVPLHDDSVFHQQQTCVRVSNSTYLCRRSSRSDWAIDPWLELRHRMNHASRGTSHGLHEFPSYTGQSTAVLFFSQRSFVHI